jgi:signal transduction histidine kinase
MAMFTAAVTIVALSIVLQIAAACLALRLVRMTGRAWAWPVIALAVSLICLRRVLTLDRLLFGSAPVGRMDLFEGCLTLVISVLLLAGIAGIGRIFRRARRLEEERLRIQERMHASQKLQSLGLLAGGIAHDFNNLTASILGHVDLVREEVPETSAVATIVHEIERAAERAADLCRQLLAYAGKGGAPMQGVDLSAVVREMSELLAVAVPRRITWRRVFQHDLPPVEADVTQVRQVVMNLITNAADAIGTAEGTIALQTGTTTCDRGSPEGFALAPPASGAYAFLEVSDTGCGMDRATVARMFEPFYTTKTQGHGLGLAAVQGIVRQHGGGIAVTSAPGRGTTIRVLLPIRAGDGGAPPGKTAA